MALLEFAPVQRAESLAEEIVFLAITAVNKNL